MNNLLMIISILALAACTTTKPAEVTDVQASSIEVSSEAVVASNDGAADAIEASLSEDLEAVERLGQVFLESSFALYDRLLKEDISEKDTDATRNAVDDSRAKYNNLVTAITKLQDSLKRSEVQEALPLSVESNREDLEEMLVSLAAYVPAEFNREDYALNDGKKLTALMFPKVPDEEPEYLATLPKANRDALLFLDHLKRISADLTSLTTTLTVWIYDSASFNAEAFVH